MSDGVSHSQRVLVTGPTHRAIHQALGEIRRAVPAAMVRSVCWFGVSGVRF